MESTETKNAVKFGLAVQPMAKTRSPMYDVGQMEGSQLNFLGFSTEEAEGLSTGTARGTGVSGDLRTWQRWGNGWTR